MRKVALFYFFCKSVWFKGNSWIIISAPASSLLQYVVWVEVHIEKIQRHTGNGWTGWRGQGRGGSILIAFSDNCGYSCLVLYQNSVSGNFLKVRCSGKSCKWIFACSGKTHWLELWMDLIPIPEIVTSFLGHL